MAMLLNVKGDGRQSLESKKCVYNVWETVKWGAECCRGTLYTWGRADSSTRLLMENVREVQRMDCSSGLRFKVCDAHALSSPSVISGSSS